MRNLDDVPGCPFCGSTEWKMYKVRSAEKSTGRHSVYIKCQKCHARGPKVTMGYGDDPEKELEAALEAWSRRT